MDRLGIAHTGLAVLALALGAAVVARRKADRLHRTTGHLYVASMLGVNVTALHIYDLFGVFGPFHAAAVVSLCTIVAGIVPVVIRRPRQRWFQMHAYFMSWSYVGLLAAAASELAVRLPAAPFAPAVLGVTLLVTVAGGVFIHGKGGWLVRRALRRAGIVAPLLAIVVLPRLARAQPALDSSIAHRRAALERAVSQGDLSQVVTHRNELARLAVDHPSHALLQYYVGYAWYRESTLRTDRDGRPEALDSAEAALERSARLLRLAETYALLSTVIGQQIGGSPWKAMLHGARVSSEMEKAAALGPDNPRVALLQGINAYYSPPAFGGGMDRARRALERAITLFAGDRPPPLMPSWGEAETWAWLGRVRARSGDTAGARAAYETALRLDPSYLWVSRVLLPALRER
jgi:uncharacterized membrane protein